MAQADGSCANASGSAFRSDLNNQLAALFTTSSGATAPATTFAYQLWADTTANSLKIRNGSNTDWIVLRGLDGALTAAGDLTTTGDVVTGDGTAAAPSYTFGTETDCGFYKYSANTVGFSTAGTHRFFIGDNNGAIVANEGGHSFMWNTTTNPISNNVSGFQITDNGRLNLGNFAQCLVLNRYTTTGSIVGIRYNSTSVGSIQVTSSSTSYNTSSDYRLKENVVALTGAKARLNDLDVKRFNFTASPSTTVDGFLAHEVATVVPEAIHGTKDEVDSDGNPVYQGIDQSKLVPLLTAALQEAFTEIAALTTRVEALEGN